jgi:hypothetical protein
MLTLVGRLAGEMLSPFFFDGRLESTTSTTTLFTVATNKQSWSGVQLYDLHRRNLILNLFHFFFEFND